LKRGNGNGNIVLKNTHIVVKSQQVFFYLRSCNLFALSSTCQWEICRTIVFDDNLPEASDSVGSGHRDYEREEVIDKGVERLIHEGSPEIT
jgi:hypothetical protein